MDDLDELRARAEEAEAQVAETRTQAERWVAESQAFMDEKIAEARDQAAAASQELDEVRAELERERELRLELERRPREAAAEPDQPEHPAPDAPAPAVSLSAGEGCSVCHRGGEGGSADKLAAEGWAAEGDARLCPSCREAGWQLAPGVDSPFRRYADRRPSGQSVPGEEPARTASNHMSER